MWFPAIVLFPGILFYVYVSLCVYVLAEKTRTPNSWMAWIPILSRYLQCKIGGKPGWWIILHFIPLVNIVIAVLVWMGIAEARNREGWLGILMLVPIVNLVVLGYLAFAE